MGSCLGKKSQPSASTAPQYHSTSIGGTHVPESQPNNQKSGYISPYVGGITAPESQLIKKESYSRKTSEYRRTEESSQEAPLKSNVALPSGWVISGGCYFNLVTLSKSREAPEFDNTPYQVTRGMPTLEKLGTVFSEIVATHFPELLGTIEDILGDVDGKVFEDTFVKLMSQICTAAHKIYVEKNLKSDNWEIYYSQKLESTQSISNNLLNNKAIIQIVDNLLTVSYRLMILCDLVTPKLKFPINTIGEYVEFHKEIHSIGLEQKQNPPQHCRILFPGVVQHMDEKMIFQPNVSYKN